MRGVPASTPPSSVVNKLMTFSLPNAETFFSVAASAHKRQYDEYQQAKAGQYGCKAKPF